MKIFIITAVFISTLLYSSSINIAVASNVSYSINNLIKEFNKSNPDIKVKVVLGSSGKLTAQISNGAPFDILMSANMKYPNALYESKIAVTKPIVYARGSLVIISRNTLNANKGLELLRDKKIRRIAVANPKTAPYGIATKEALVNAGLYTSLKSKFVYGESVSQTLSYAITAADLGFIAKSSLFSPHMKKYKKGINWIDIDEKFYTPINQGVVIVKHGDNNPNVRKFYDFLLSENAKSLFKKFGYIAP